MDALKTKVSEFNYNNWFGLCGWSVDTAQNQVKIEAPNKFVRDWILENYHEIIKFLFFKTTGQEFEVYFHVGTQAAATPETVVSTSDTIKKPALSVVTEESEPVLPTGFSPKYTFDQFVVGSSNQFVNAASLAVAQNPGKNYNPLFIYGGVGLGKTHLLNAIGLEIYKKNPSYKIVYVTGEQFTNEVINSIRYDKTYELRKKYRACDVLLIDDIQFIAGKERTMEEFFHTFNALYEMRKQIILTSDTLPKDIPHLEERLRSRFGWGLLADIQAPDFETRCAILRKKAQLDGIHFPDDVCNFIASHIKSNVRDLEGSLIRLTAFASLSKQPLTVSLANEVLRNMLHGFTPTLTVESIQQSVAEYFQLKVADLKSPRRHKNLAVPRQIAMYLCKKHVKASFPEIGQKFGGKDHTTVIHACQKIKKEVDNNVGLRDNVTTLEKMLAQTH
ncbi:chromosomal replication initiator protein DnaA [bacterium]|nr:chromosomal replication initiator protein DnaA [bacterium]